DARVQLWAVRRAQECDRLPAPRMEQQGRRIRRLWRQWRGALRGNTPPGGQQRRTRRRAGADRPLPLHRFREFHDLQAGSPSGADGHRDARSGHRLGWRLEAPSHAEERLASMAGRYASSVDDLWRRAGVPAAAIVQLAYADEWPKPKSELSARPRTRTMVMSDRGF